MKIPNYTFCPICNELLTFRATSISIFCPKTNSNDPFDSHFRYYEPPKPFVVFRFKNVILGITENNTWTISIYDSNGDGGDTLASGFNANELFNLDNVKALEETAELIGLYT